MGRNGNGTIVSRSLYGYNGFGIITYRSAVIRLNTNRWTKRKINRLIGDETNGMRREGVDQATRNAIGTDHRINVVGQVN